MKIKIPRSDKKKPQKKAHPDRKRAIPAITRRVLKGEKTAVDFFGLHNLKVPAGAHKRKKILGRGSSSGHGKTSTRGSKGQTSRSGRDYYLGFEGGQTPLIRRIPKRGFINRFKKEYQIVNIGDLGRLKEQLVSLEILEKSGLIKDRTKPVKILGDGELKAPLTVCAHAFSKSAAQKIKDSGGRIDVVAEIKN
ncbi:MAG: 50S ribosomal protein L15 [Candidatus Omnitrophica bacterium]|nr:50S ribosomal protein L15 [Candidatus Omnitrophota bacterium]